MHSSIKLELTARDLTIDKENRLGRGNFGEVFLGKYRNKPVAIKVCHSNLKANIDMKDSINSLKQERAVFNEISQRITAENQTEYGFTGLIQYHGCLENFTGYKFLLVMEYANAGSLLDWVFNTKQNKLPAFNWGLGLTVVHDILKGLYTLHKFKYIHGDIKTDNILLDLDDAGQVHGKICDFGLAVSESEVEDADIGGSPGFMAPELLCGEDLNTKSDIYSFACVLLEMAKQDEIYKDITFKSIDDVKEHVVVKNQRDTIPPATPKPIAHMMTLGWMKKPEDRPSAEQLIAMLPAQDAVEEIKGMGGPA